MVLIHLATGFEEIEALTAADLLRRAEKDVQLLSVTANSKANSYSDPIHAG